MSYYWTGNRMIKMPDKEQLRLSDFSFLEDLRGVENATKKKNHKGTP